MKKIQKVFVGSEFWVLLTLIINLGCYLMAGLYIVLTLVNIRPVTFELGGKEKS